MHNEHSARDGHAGNHDRQAAPERAQPSKAQTMYANLLFYGCWIGLAVMVLTYAVYVFGLATPYVPLESVALYWSQPVGHYLREARVPVGWGWLSLMGKGDFLNFAGMVLLAGMSVICYLRILPFLIGNKLKIMAGIAVLEVLTLILAASGLVSAGAH
jgi:hypothetical protein